MSEFGLLLPGEAATRLSVSTTKLTELANAGRLSVVWTKGASGHRRYYEREVELLAELRAVERLALDRAARVAELEAVVSRLGELEARLEAVRAAVAG